MKGEKTGGRQKGTPNRSTADIKAAAEIHGPDMLKVLAKIATSGKSQAARVSAANAILDRAYGKPKQSVDVEANVRAAITEVRRTIVDPQRTNS